MRKIQMVDLQTQYQFIKPQVDAGMQEVLSSAQFINGPAVRNFQANLEAYLEVKHVIPCANGTDALQVAMMGLGLKPGDEVITADFTFAATVEVIALLGLTPVLVDVLPDTFNIDPDAIEKVITPNTKAIVPVHLFGQVADMDRIMDIAQKHNLFVIEDNAQGIGATHTDAAGTKVKTGGIGHVGSTSFFPSKNLGCYGDGCPVLVLDTVGMLSRCYPYASLAYVGGGMGNAGLHNILEPAAQGVPIIIGKNYDTFPEAKDLIALGGVTSISTAKECTQQLSGFMQNEALRQEKGNINRTFVTQNQGATQHTLTLLKQHL